MDHFVVSARKYRPSTFNSVIGQPAITNTLKNAISSKHLAQAFLFCGPRGVGKTTCARILAKTINCTNLTPDTEGCNQCESCVSFNNGQSLNIFELDAASNNSVEDMRNLVDQVRYAPQTGQFKIYIIDEVHMLSQAAFNAFLKTLEEPPSYAIFILATTEKHKIISTILSRCQIFDFNRITIDDIAKHLQWIAENENVNAEPDALHIIAQKADGALRDALSIFDQIVSFAGSTVTYKNVIDNLNILDYEYYFRITDFIITGNFPETLLLLNEIIDEGFDLHHFLTGLSSHFRDLLVCKDVQTISLLQVSAKTRERYKAQSQQTSAGMLFRYLETGNKCDVEFKASQNQRLHVELALLKMCAFSQNAFPELLNTIPAAPEKKTLVQTNPTKTPAEIRSASDTEIKIPRVESKAESIKEPIAQYTSASDSPGVPSIATSEKPVTSQESNSPVENLPRSRTAATISISKKLQATKKPVDTASEITKDEIPLNSSFDGQLLIKTVKELADKFSAEGRRQLAATLNKNEPNLLADNQVEFIVDNPIQADDILSNKHEILAYLKQKLSNTGISLISRVAFPEEYKNTAYTPAEKFSKMAEKNPDLNQLKQQFDLELDF